MILFGIIAALKLSEEHDGELVKRLQGRDPDAMRDLYDRFGRLAWSVILSIVRDRSAAEDLLQETFLRVWNRVHGFEAGRGSLGPWLLAIARNQAIDHVRSRNLRICHGYELEVSDQPALFIDIEDDILSADSARLMRNAISKLNANQQKVIELAYYEGLSQVEMAERMGQPLGTVKTWVRSALRKLREELGEAPAA